jgi:hypothetical protein
MRGSACSKVIPKTFCKLFRYAATRDTLPASSTGTRKLRTHSATFLAPNNCSRA